MNNFLLRTKQLFCHHKWSEDGAPMNFCATLSLFQLHTPKEEKVLRRQYYKCSKCYKYKSEEEFVIKTNY
jgi:hypothetical protein